MNILLMQKRDDDGNAVEVHAYDYNAEGCCGDFIEGFVDLDEAEAVLSERHPRAQFTYSDDESPTMAC